MNETSILLDVYQKGTLHWAARWRPLDDPRPGATTLDCEFSAFTRGGAIRGARRHLQYLVNKEVRRARFAKDRERHEVFVDMSRLKAA